MLKKNKWKLLLTSAVILLPVVFGLIVWDKLPERLAIHWSFNGTADGWSSRSFAVFAIPVFILAMHWFCAFCTTIDSKNKNQNGKVVGIILWICPAASLFANTLIYTSAFEKKLDIYFFTCVLIGIMYVAIGNYLPKCRQNSTIGIKVMWALQNEENWNATHRLAGKAWVIGGVLIILSAFLPENVSLYSLMTLLIVLVLLPIGYSYYYYKTKQKS